MDYNRTRHRFWMVTKPAGDFVAGTRSGRNVGLTAKVVIKEGVVPRTSSKLTDAGFSGGDVNHDAANQVAVERFVPAEIVVENKDAHKFIIPQVRFTCRKL